MSTYEIVPCTLAHLRILARDMRPADRDEIEMVGLVPRHLLVKLWRMSVKPQTVLVDGEVAACWGDASPMLAREASIWLFTTAAIERIPIAYFKEAKREIRERLQYRDSLFAHVPCSYQKSLRFFRMLGCQVSDAVDGALFHEVRISNVV